MDQADGREGRGLASFVAKLLLETERPCVVPERVGVAALAGVGEGDVVERCGLPGFIRELLLQLQAALV